MYTWSSLVHFVHWSVNKVYNNQKNPQQCTRRCTTTNNPQYQGETQSGVLYLHIAPLCRHECWCRSLLISIWRDILSAIVDMRSNFVAQSDCCLLSIAAVLPSNCGIIIDQAEKKDWVSCNQWWPDFEINYFFYRHLGCQVVVNITFNPIWVNPCLALLKLWDHKICTCRI